MFTSNVDTMIRGSIVVSISPVTRKTRAQFPAAEITAAHGGEQDDDDSSSRKRRTVMSCVAYGSGHSGCPWRPLVKITDETRRWPSSGPGKSSQTLGRPATARTLSPLVWVTLRLCILPSSRPAQVAH